MSVARGILAVPLLILSVQEARAGLCVIDFDWEGYAEIPIWIHPDLAENLMHADGSVWTDAEISAEIKYSVETLQENLPNGAPKFVVKSGTHPSNPAWDQFILGAIHVVPHLSPCFDFTCGCNNFFGSMEEMTAPSGGVRLVLARSGGAAHSSRLLPGRPAPASGRQ